MGDPDFELMPVAEMIALLKRIVRPKSGHPGWDEEHIINLSDVSKETKISRTWLRKMMRGEPNQIRRLGYIRLTRFLRKHDVGMLVKSSLVISEVDEPTKAPTVIKSVRFLMSGRPVIESRPQNGLNVAKLPNFFKTGLHKPKGLL